MSDAVVDQATHLNLADTVARIERAQAETRKFVAEQSKLSAEQLKFSAEQSRLVAEAAKIVRDRALVPWQLAAAFMAAGAAFFWDRCGVLEGDRGLKPACSLEPD